jgi:serine/threonine-protein kinase
LPSGHLVYALGPALFAIPFDPAARTVGGGPVPMLEGLRRASAGFTDAANFAVSDTGTLVMIPGVANAVIQSGIGATLAWVDRDGREEPLPLRPGDYSAARVSPDGTKIALVVGALLQTGTSAIWIYDLRTENVSLLAGPESDVASSAAGDTANVPIGDDGPVWSSDSRRVIFRSFRAGSLPTVHSIDVETGETTLVATASADFPNPLPWSLSPDDRTLTIVTAAVVENLNVATLSLADGQFARLLDTEAHESEPAISPNGAWLAYAGISGDPASEINIRPFPGVSRTRIPVGSGQLPVFSRDGSELFYYDGTGLAVAPITYEPTLRVGAPRRLFESATYVWSMTGRAWDVDPTGERFLMIRFPGLGTPQAGGDPETTRIDVVLNWVEELKRRVPVE